MLWNVHIRLITHTFANIYFKYLKHYKTFGEKYIGHRTFNSFYSKTAVWKILHPDRSKYAAIYSTHVCIQARSLFYKGSDTTVQFAPKSNQDFVDLLTLEDGADMLSQNVGTELPL